MPGFSSRGIFLSYRREDAAPYARSLQVQLHEGFPDAQVFMDLDAIEAGLDFAEVIEQAVGSSAVLVALIGRQWVTLTDDEGNRRLDNPDDFVRFEVHTALVRGVRVIPVLVDGARPLRRQDLPDELHQLARLNAFKLSYDRYQDDANRLVDLIREILGVAPGTGTVHRPAAAADPGAPVVIDPPMARADENGQGGATQKEPEPGGGNRARATRVLAEAERVARSMIDESMKAEALAIVAKALAATDADRAARLNDDAEGAAQSIIYEPAKVKALADLAAGLAAVDADRAARLIDDAERIAGSGTDENSAMPVFAKGMALADVAESMAAIDPDRAEGIARSITDESSKATALTNVVKVLSATGPDRAPWLIGDAERIARSITDESMKAAALADVAKALAATEPDRASWLIDDAEGIAQSIAYEPRKSTALASVVEALAAIDPDRAERTVQSVADENRKATALASIAGALAATDPDRAEDIAQSITDQSLKATALASVGTQAASDPARAVRLTRDAERIARSIADEFTRAMTLADVAGALAATDPDRAEYIARSITDELWRVSALVRIAEGPATAGQNRT